MSRFIVILLFLVSPVIVAGAQGYNEISPEVKARAESLLSKMTLEEKIDYIGGYASFYIRGLDRLGIPEIRMADGPQGVRNNTKSTLFPCGMAAAATWDRDLIYRMGEALGQDSRARGVHILLGPGVNMYKMPLCGRNFEYFGEDPYLAGETAAAYISGLQKQGVMACVKHFAVNNLEWGRHVVSADVDERTLNELYFPAFEKAVRKAGVGAVMDSYNLVNSVHSTENAYLNRTVLRDRWGFEGILMSDWTATYSVIGALYGGLDLEMPNGIMMNKSNILPLIKNGIVEETVIDEKVRHILQTLIAFGFFDREQLDNSIPEINPLSDSVALEVARGAIVLLKNQDGFLPVKKGRIVICGPRADEIVTGGGSGMVYPVRTCSVAQGMASLGKGISPKLLDAVMDSALDDFYADAELTVKGATVEYFSGKDLSGEPLYRGTVPAVDFDFDTSSPVEGTVPADGFSARYTFWCRPVNDSGYFMSLGADDGYRLIIDGVNLLEDWSNHSFRKESCFVNLEAGCLHKIQIEYYDNASDARVEFLYAGMLDSKEDISAVKNADAVVVCLGFDSSSEKENADRSFSLPEGQVEYLEKVLEYNENVVVVLNAGGGVEMAPWIENVKAVLMAWYPGQAGGLAVSEIIAGRISPSGKLPISIEKKLEDNPSYGSYFENTSRVRSYNPYRRVAYNEGIFTGYRGYDRNDVEPLFEFGYGLSYSDFRYSGLVLEQTDEGVEVSFELTNTGKYDAAEIVQIYVGDRESSVLRPEKELKGYDKVFLKAGETARVKVLLGQESFRYYDIDSHDFIVEPGVFDISVGSSSSDIRLSGSIYVG